MLDRRGLCDAGGSICLTGEVFVSGRFFMVDRGL